MDKSAIFQAAASIEKAIASIEAMKNTTDRRQFHGSWSDFLSASHRTFAKLEQGAKVSGPSKAWFGSKIHERRTDPLLSYIHHARNVDEHGLEGSAHPATKRGEPQLHQMIDIAGSGKDMKVSARPFIMQNILADTRSARLFPVTDRGVTYNPPTEHMGRQIENLSAIGITELAVAYLRVMVGQANQLP
jgi:hypothetical protein